MTKKQTHIMIKLLNRNDTLACLSSAFCDGNKKDFKELYGATFKEAENAIDALVQELAKSIYECKY